MREKSDAIDAEPSRSQRKREMTARQKLGERLVALPPDQLRAMGLPEELAEAVLAAKEMTRHGARRRQMQRIGVLMREVDPGPIRTALENVGQTRRVEVYRFQRAERWRTRLLAGDAALAEDLASRYAADGGALLHRLVADARKHPAPPQTRKLFRYLVSLPMSEAGDGP